MMIHLPVSPSAVVGTSIQLYLDINELERHLQVLVERLNFETNRYERTSLEDHIVAVEALIDGLRTSAIELSTAGGRDD